MSQPSRAPLQRQSATTDVRTSSGPLAVQAEILYRSMSDADATAASAFLSTGAEPPALRTRYLNDIDAAGAALVNASAGDVADRDALRQIATGLPIYTGLVETARADNHLGLPRRRRLSARGVRPHAQHAAAGGLERSTARRPHS